MTARSKEVATRPNAGALAAFTDMTGEQVELVKNTVARGASDDELALFLHLARAYELDPFAKEIWCIKQVDENGNPKTDRHGNEYPAQITVARDGFLKIAEMSGVFDGIVSGVVKENDEFDFGLEAPVHKFGRGEDGKRGGIVGAYAYVYRTDRSKPFRVFAEWAEHGFPPTHNRDGTLKSLQDTKSPWRHYPSSMIRKVAEANALRLAFRVSGVVAQEAPDEEAIDGDVVDAEVVSETPARPDDTPPAEAQQPTNESGDAGADPAGSETQSDRDAATSPGASEPGGQGELEGLADDQ